jgi:hypothetical protein
LVQRYNHRTRNSFCNLCSGSAVYLAVHEIEEAPRFVLDPACYGVHLESLTSPRATQMLLSILIYLFQPLTYHKTTGICILSTPNHDWKLDCMLGTTKTVESIFLRCTESLSSSPLFRSFHQLRMKHRYSMLDQALKTQLRS